MNTRPMTFITSTRAPFGVSIDRRRGPACRADNSIGREQCGCAFDEDQSLALVEGVIAERDAIGAGVEEFLRRSFR